MLCLVVSECNDKSFKKTKRILSSYMSQKGRRTWMDQITQEGLQDLYHELKSSATKSTSVQCYQVGNKKVERIWRVGNTTHFTEEGEYAFASTRKDYLSGETLDTAYSRVSHYASVIASLLHDIGKINAQFQDKIVAQDLTHAADFARHELISCMVYSKVILPMAMDGMSEMAMLAHLKDPEALTARFKDALSGELFASLKGDDVFNEMRIAEHGDDYPLMAAIMFMIASHHKLAAGQDRGGKLIATLQKHINERVTDQDRITMNRQYDEGKYNFMTDPNSRFITTLCDHFQRLHDVLAESPAIEYRTLMQLMSYYNRVALIMSDRYISSIDDYTQAYSDKEFYANSRIVDKRSKARAHAQTLHDHLVQVGRQTGRNFRRILRLMREQDLPSINSRRLPSTLKPGGLDPKERFYWQDDMVRRLKTKRRDGIVEAGFFGVLVAGTGSGKTRANAKMISAISDEVRYTLGVGLRTLTLQTQTEYLKDVRLDPQDVGMLIGSDVSKRLYELNQTEQNEDASALGIDAEQDDEVDGTFTRDFEGEEAMGEEFAALLKPKERSMLMYPVVVCTVDHIIKVANMTKGRHLAASLRTMTADLILDEVDSYSDVDLVSIGKLVYRTGMSGRRVILSSATVNPDVVEALHEAYRAGYEAYCQLTGKTPTIFAGWFSEYAAINKVTTVADNTEFATTHHRFITSLSDRLSSTPPRRKGAILKLAEQKDETEVMTGLLRACEDLHATHHTVCKKTGVRFSCGMVRWNKVKHAIRFTQQLLGEESSYLLRVMCYHSKQVAYVLDIQSEFLNKLLSRKDPQAIFDHPMVRDAVKEAKEQGVKDVLFVMSTTSIEEVGRDHDFDYAITEPSSYRSLIQLAGRVKRHRVEVCHSPNLLVLDRPVDRLGPATEKRGSSKDLQKVILNKMGTPSKRISERPGEAWDAAKPVGLEEFLNPQALSTIDARTCLLGRAVPGESDPLALYEFGKRELALRGTLGNVSYTSPELLSLKKYIDDPACYQVDFHYNKNPFRSRQASQLFYRDEDYGWMRMRENAFDEAPISANALVRTMEVNDPYGRLAIKDGYDERLSEIIERLKIQNDPRMKQSLQSVSITVYDEEANILVEYHDALGMVKRDQT